MKAFPMFIRTTGRRVVIVGGGEQAAQKARLLLKTDAELILVAGELEAELSGLVVEGRAVHERSLSVSVFDGAAMAFVGTGCPGLDAAAQMLAKAARCPVNDRRRRDVAKRRLVDHVDRTTRRLGQRLRRGVQPRAPRTDKRHRCPVEDRHGQ